MRPTKDVPTADRLATERWLMPAHRVHALIKKVADVGVQPLIQAYDDDVVAEATEEPSYTVENGVAIIPVVGVLTKYPTWFDGWCCFCPSLLVQAAIAEALNDGSVNSIALRIDSPGGLVAGTNELAEFIGKVNGTGAGQKPIDAIVSDLAASGGYMLASQCRTIYANTYAEIGSIGVYCVLADVSAAYEDMGIKFSVVTSGGIKGAGADGKITPELIADEQRGVDAYYQLFLNMVATGRGMTFDRAKTLGTGQCWTATEAKNLGLIDVVASVDDAIGQITSQPTNDTGIVAGGTAAPKASKAAIGGKPLMADGQGAMMDPKKRAYLESIGLRTDATDDEATQFYNLLNADKQAEADNAVNAPADDGTTAVKQPANQPQATKPSLADYAAACEGDKVAAYECAVAGMSIDQAKAAYGMAKQSRESLANAEAELKQLKAELGTQDALNLGGAGAAGGTTSVAGGDYEATAKSEWAKMSADDKAKWADNEGYFVAFRKKELAA